MHKTLYTTLSRFFGAAEFRFTGGTYTIQFSLENRERKEVERGIGKRKKESLSKGKRQNYYSLLTVRVGLQKASARARASFYRACAFALFSSLPPAEKRPLGERPIFVPGDSYEDS